MRLRKRLITEVLPFLDFIKQKKDSSDFSNTDKIKVIASLTEYAILTKDQKIVFRAILSSEKSITTMGLLEIVQDKMRITPHHLGTLLDIIYLKTDLIVCSSGMAKKKKWSARRPESFVWNEKYRKV